MKTLYYSYSKEAFTKVADVWEEYDNIAQANEIRLPYIAYVYGKSKMHLIRITGILWAIDVAFQVLAKMDSIPDKKEAFIESVFKCLELVNDSNVIPISIVQMTIMVMDFFIDHKMILSGLEKDATNPNEFKYIKVAAKSKDKVSENSNLPTQKVNDSLEHQILTTNGNIVFLTPLSKAGKADKESFKLACEALESKGLGLYSKFKPTSKSSRSANGFRKSTVPSTHSDAEVVFINSLFDFGCSLEVYKETLSHENVLPPTTPVSQTKAGTSGLKRLSKETSMQDITNSLSQHSNKKGKHQNDNDEQEDYEEEEEEN